MLPRIWTQGQSGSELLTSWPHRYRDLHRVPAFSYLLLKNSLLLSRAGPHHIVSSSGTQRPLGPSPLLQHPKPLGPSPPLQHPEPHPLQHECSICSLVLLSCKGQKYTFQILPSSSCWYLQNYLILRSPERYWVGGKETDVMFYLLFSVLLLSKPNLKVTKNSALEEQRTSNLYDDKRGFSAS